LGTLDYLISKRSLQLGYMRLIDVGRCMSDS